MRWALAATKDAQHFWHIDSDGFATYIVPQCGKKLVFVGKPKNWTASRSYDSFADSNLFSEIDVADPNSERWEAEYVILDDNVEL